MTQKNSASPAAPVIPGLEQCIALLRASKLDAFEATARQLAVRHPKASKPLQLVGVAALMRGRLQEAVDALQAAARLNQNDPTIWDNLGVALQRAGHNRAAAECFQGSVRLDPDVAAVWVNAAANFGEMGDYVLARNCAARAVKLAPDLVEAHLNLGNALRLLGDSGAAVKALLRAIELDPGCAPAHMGLSRAMSEHGSSELALKHARLALEIDPDYPDGKLAYAILCGFADDQVDLLSRYLRATPSDISATQGLLGNLLMDQRRSPEEVFAAHKAFAARFEPAYQHMRMPHPNVLDPERRLRIGFLSGDYRRHPTADHIEPLWRGLARDKVAIHAYYTHPGDDETTRRLRALTDVWVDAADMSDEALSARIREDGVDILIDLACHTSHNRIGVLLRKPAPIQMHWIGYLHSTGLSLVDYYIADPILAPAPFADAFCSEKLIRLPTYNVQQGMLDAPDVGPLPARANGYVTFGATGRAIKINAAVIALWARVLHAVPTARMLVADASVEEFRARVLGYFAEHGIDADRIIFRPRGSEREYMAMHNDIDIVLDTFPYGGGTTVTHAMHMGVPTLTLPGPFMAQRMAAARLAAVGLHDWIATDPDNFVALASRKAAAVDDLAGLRVGLRELQSSSPLRQPAAFAAAFEAGLRGAWCRLCAGEAPAPIDVALQSAAPPKRARRPRKPASN
jgi:predicted O-linked N-acetylglucosamine transferase (SPINDLY family)